MLAELVVSVVPVVLAVLVVLVALLALVLLVLLVALVVLVLLVVRAAVLLVRLRCRHRLAVHLLIRVLWLCIDKASQALVAYWRKRLAAPAQTIVL